jgi:mannose-6-phosphate isomerase-like protein (cupin superfamily)
MAYAGQILENLVSGERIICRKTASGTAGEPLAFELFLVPDDHVPSAPVHPQQEERFEVVKGTMKFRRGLKTVFARVGDTAVLPPGVVHRFGDRGDELAHVVAEVRPALRMEQLLETATTLAGEGCTSRKGMPKPLELALRVREFERGARAPCPPASVVVAPLAWLAASRSLGERYRRPSPVLVDGTLPAHTDPSYPAARKEVA